MEEIKQILSQHYTEQLTPVQTEWELAKLGPEALAEFILEAKERGWITNFNLGLDDEGNLI